MVSASVEDPHIFERHRLNVILGLFLSLYAISTVILLKDRKRVKIKTPMLAVSSAMLVAATVVWLK